LYPKHDQRAEAAALLESINENEIEIPLQPDEACSLLLYKDRQLIFSEYEPGNSLYIIQKGRVEIYKRLEDKEVLLSILKEGDIFGELAITSDKPRNATAISSKDTILLPVEKKSLEKTISDKPEILHRIFAAISQRIWFTYQRMDLILFRRPVTRIYSFLENKLEEEKIDITQNESFTFNLNFDDLLKMLNIPHDIKDDALDDFFSDSNLSFNFGQIKIHNTSRLAATAAKLRQIDNMQIDDKQ